MNLIKNTLHVFPNKGKWGVKRTGSTKALRVFQYREIAYLYANVIANEKTIIIVYNQDNNIAFTTNKLIITE